MLMQSSALYKGRNEHIWGCSAPGESSPELLLIQSFTIVNFWKTENLKGLYWFPNPA